MTFCRIRFSILICILLIFISHTSQAQSVTQAGIPDIVIRVGSASVVAGAHDARIPIYLQNFNDTVAAFDMRFSTERPDLVSFHQSIDTTSSLIAGWEFVGLQMFGEGDTLRVMGIADRITPTERTPGIGYPQWDDIPIFSLKVDIADDSGSELPFEIEVEMLADSARYLVISDEEGYSIGIVADSVLDTVFYRCTNWADPEQSQCLNWTIVTEVPFDSLSVHYVHFLRIDTTNVLIYPGEMTVDPALCGDVSGDDDKVTLSDITGLIGYVYLDGPAPPNLWAANVNGSEDDKVTLTDITAIIDHVYISKKDLECR